MSALIQDLRFSIRSLTNQPIFAAIAVLTLALGIGANSAIFSVVHAVLLHPIPYPNPQPEQVLVLTESSTNWDEISVSYPDLNDWQAQNRAFTAMAGVCTRHYDLTGLDEPVRLTVDMVSHSYFAIMGVKPLLGRLFTAEEDQPGAPGRAILNFTLWQSRFAGDPGVVGQTVRLNDEAYTVTGILPADFELDPQERAYIPLAPWSDDDKSRARGNHRGIIALARLRSGVTMTEARTEMETIAARLEQQFPETNSGIGVTVSRYNERLVEDYQTTLLLLLGAVSLVLLIACSNVAHLLLARSLGRRREIAVQVALGAGRWRIIRQGMTDGVLLALLGGALGLLLAYSGFDLLLALLPTDVPRINQVQINGPVLAFTLAVSFITGILFGSVPAIFASRVKETDPLKVGSRDTGGRSRLGRYLLVGEVALATVLLIGAGLLIRSAVEVTRIDPGFRTDNLLTMEIGLPATRYTGASRSAFLQDLETRARTLPGVTAATVGLNLPMTGSDWSSIFIVDDRPAPPRSELPSSLFTPVGPGYFKTFEIPLIRGRMLRGSDRAEAQPVVVVNQTLANHFWPGEDPIGKQLKQGWPEDEGERNPWREIVGVVGDSKQLGLDAVTRMQTYIPLAQAPPWRVRLALRTASDPMAVAAPVRKLVRTMDADLPVYDLHTMDELISTSVAPRRFTMLLLGIFAGLALLLAAVGLYGVIAYSVARRTREIGVRVAVGATARDVFQLVVQQGMRLSLLGLMLGIAGALALTHLLASLLYGISPVDPVVFLVAPVILLATAFLACTAPALLATYIDPMRALRNE
jgi:putative ABC transport system permease protein